MQSDKSLKTLEASDNCHSDNQTIRVNGALITAEALVAILDMVTRPISGRWYTFERVGDCIQVTTEQRNASAQSPTEQPTTPNPHPSPIDATSSLPRPAIGIAVESAKDCFTGKALFEGGGRAPRRGAE